MIPPKGVYLTGDRIYVDGRLVADRLENKGRAWVASVTDPCIRTKIVGHSFEMLVRSILRAHADPCFRAEPEAA